MKKSISPSISSKIAKLIDVKSIVTFVVVSGVTYGFITHLVGSETYSAFAGSIIAYYFTRKGEGA